jgi:hypothetical protein
LPTLEKMHLPLGGRRRMVARAPRNRPQADEIVRLGNRGRVVARRYTWKNSRLTGLEAGVARSPRLA